MTDDIRQLQTALDKLHAELEDIERADPEVRRLLTDALAEIQETLGRGQSSETPGSGEEDDSVAHRLAEAARGFEESHPTLSGMIGSVIDALSRMGI